MRLHEEMKILELQILEHKKKESEAEARLKEQQIVYEAVRNDRNAFSKSLIESKVDSAIRSNTVTWICVKRVFKDDTFI